MIKIKDFTLASKNLGEGTCPPPPVPNTTSTYGDYLTLLTVSKLCVSCIRVSDILRFIISCMYFRVLMKT